MGRGFICWITINIISFIILTSLVNAQNEVDYRLPRIYSPSHYTIDLNLDQGIFNGSVTTFGGKSSVTFSVLEETPTIKIHGTVTVGSLELISENGNIYSTNFTYDNVTEILSIVADSNLTIGVNYTLSFNYTGDFDLADMRGFYRSEYFNEAGNKVYLVTTQFQSTYARQAFPCFDEPGYKSKFNISITYPVGLLALGNTPILNTENIDAQYEKAVFTETPVMPTYLIAFIVSDFNCTQGNDIDVGVPHRVCSSKQTAEDRDLAVEFGPRIIHALQNMTGLKYKDQGLGKMDQVALPDFAAGAMENWGLVTYREVGLLWNKLVGPNSYKEKTLTIIAHEFTHMWFGDLVTCDWWDYTFLNEGFARYFQYFAITKLTDIDVDEVWEMAKQFIIEQQQVVFVSDSSMSSKELTSVSASPSEVRDKFSTISYSKGASIIRMLENVMGSDKFFAGLNAYLTEHAFSTSVPYKLWNSLQPYFSPSALPTNITLSDVMENWVNASGFPLVTVNIRGNNIVLSQERFLYNTSEYDDTKYYIPITYTTSNMSNPFVEVSPSVWLLPTNKVTLNDVFLHNDWFILNNQQSAYYRVNYDYSLWEKIKAVLQSDHSKVHVMNRAQIVDDALNLARAGIIDYSQAFSILAYLKNETEYFPWYPTITGFNFLRRVYGEDSETGQKLNNFEKELIEGVFNSVSFTKLNASNQIYSLKLSMILNRACKLGVQSCITSVQNLFEDYKTGTSIDKNLRTTVYCYALRYSNNIANDFSFLWEKFKSEKGATEKYLIMSALGCTKDTNSLKTFLNETLNSDSGIRMQDFSNAWSAVYTAGPEGIDAALDFFLENHERIYAYYSSASSLLSNIANRITKEAQISKLETYSTTSASTSLQEDIASAINSTKSMNEWAKQRKNQIDAYFESATPTAQTPTVRPPTTLCTTKSPDGSGTTPSSTTPEDNGSEMIKTTSIHFVFLLVSTLVIFVK